jgi:hypothetical protein
MPINVQCKCGKRMGVSQVMAGRKIRCSHCGLSLRVPAAPPSPAMKKPVKKPEVDLSQLIDLSPEKIGGYVVLALIGVSILAYYNGPRRASQEFDALLPKAGIQIGDVVEFALRAYLSQHISYTPFKIARVPSVDAPVQFDKPMFAMTLPDKIQFHGMSNQGIYSGLYDTHSGEIEANIAYGGYTVGGMVALSRATGMFHITGREKDGTPQAEIDGVSLQIYNPPPTHH